MNMLTSPTVTMSSVEISELCDKRHDNVMRDIKAMLSDLEMPALRFEGSYKGSNGKDLPCYNLPRDLTETLLLGYSAPLRLKVIRRLRELEANLATARPLSTAETLMQMLQMQIDAEHRQMEQAKAISDLDARVDQISQAHTILDALPPNAESITHIRARMSKAHGLSSKIVNAVMRSSPYAPKVHLMVRNPNVEAEGSHFAAFWKQDVTAIFKRFVNECTHSAGNLYIHPYIDGRFKLVQRE
jgi:phage regulator Rha-like protein